jgi:Ca2+-binding EF-hand superfamily protein
MIRVYPSLQNLTTVKDTITKAVKFLRELLKLHRSKSPDTAVVLFRSCDETTPNGYIAKREFVFTLRKIHQTSNSNFDFDSILSTNALTRICNQFASEVKGTIDYMDFLLFIQEGEETESLRILKDILLKSKMKANDLCKHFSSSKTYLRGYCKTSEFEKVVAKLYPKVSTHEIECLTQYFDEESDGIVDFNLFIYWLYIGKINGEVIIHLYIYTF